MPGHASLLGLPAELKGAVLEYVGARTAEHRITPKKPNKCLAPPIETRRASAWSAKSYILLERLICTVTW